jgi:hypothetical protein
MRTKKISAFLILMLILIIQACTPDNTNNISPDTRSQFLGSWTVNDHKTKAVYEVVISADPNAGNRVLISNFGGLGSGSATAFISGTSITLDPDQNINNLIFNGSGSLNGTSTMNWSYSINDGADITYYSAVFTKK